MQVTLAHKENKEKKPLNAVVIINERFTHFEGVQKHTLSERGTFCKGYHIE